MRPGTCSWHRQIVIARRGEGYGKIRHKPIKFRHASMFKIGLLVYPDCMPAGLFAFTDMVLLANHRARKHLFETSFLSVDGCTVACAHGTPLSVAGSLQDTNVDALLVPGFWADSLKRVEATCRHNNALIDSFARLPKSVKIWSYCTGVCLVAESGRLDRQAATVTWWLADAMRHRHTKVNWQVEQTCIIGKGVGTASGVNGHLPIAQKLIERQLSLDAFRDLAKLMVLPRPGQTHPAFQPVSFAGQPDPLVQKLHIAVEQTPASELTAPYLAGMLCTSERTLARKIKGLTGVTLSDYMRRIKLNQVSERLITTSLPASTISDDLGFSSDAAMRRMFKDLTHHTPLEYRQKFGRS